MTIIDTVKTYYDKQADNLKLVPCSENYIKIQISSVNGRTNWMNITEGQLRQILAVLNKDA